MTTFDISDELELAARIPFNECELPLVWSMGAVGYSDGTGGTAIPTYWQAEGGMYVCGYQTDHSECIIFVDWPVLKSDDAKDFALRVTALACQH